MSLTENTINNSMLSTLSKRAGQNITLSIHDACEKTGVNFAYLMEQAAAESNFDPNAQANSSSASGLFQFIESTWLNMVRDHGDKYGLEDYALAINSKGCVSDHALKQEILDLRFNPEISSAMAAELAAENKAYMERHLDGDIGSTELYFAHFMGAGKGTAFLQARQETPLTYAADLFPKEARANRNVFYDSKTQKPKTLEEVYAFFDQKFSSDENPETFEIAQNIPTPQRKPSAIPSDRFVSIPENGPVQTSYADPWIHNVKKETNTQNNASSSLNNLSNRLSSDLSQWLILSHFSDSLPLSQRGANDHS